MRVNIENLERKKQKENEQRKEKKKNREGEIGEATVVDLQESAHNSSDMRSTHTTVW